MYLGGNGYYWVTGTRKGEPACIEVRKLEKGSRAWQAEPGGGFLACTGQLSGLWRNRGRAPQEIGGLGFTAESMAASEPFEQMPDRDLVVTVECTPRFQGMGLRRLTLRRLTQVDMLSRRKHEVARALSDGHSHKEVDHLLGLAPATVGNQAQSIYQRLGLDNRASLSAMLARA